MMIVNYEINIRTLGWKSWRDDQGFVLYLAFHQKSWRFLAVARGIGDAGGGTKTRSLVVEL